MKKTQDQFPDINKVDVPEGFGYVTPETQEEMAQEMKKEKKAKK